MGAAGMQDKKGAAKKPGAEGGDSDGPGGEHRALIMQLIQRATKWNAGHAELVAEFNKVSGGADGSSAVAVIKWQRAHGLKADGCVGPKTVEAARKAAGVAAAPAGEAAQGAEPKAGAQPGSEPKAAGEPHAQAGEPKAAGEPQAAGEPRAQAAGVPQAAGEPKPQAAGEPQAGAAAATGGAPAKKDAPAHPMAAKAGHAAGKFVGEVVTEGLALLPSWNKPVLDDQGKPVESVPGATRVGDHDIEKRHQEVVGPEISALADRIPAGILHDFVAGFGDGATEAPGDSYRNEAAVSDKLSD